MFFALSVALSAVILIAVAPTFVIGDSMAPALHTNSHVLTNFLDNNPQRGDIITFTPRGDAPAGPAIVKMASVKLSGEPVYIKRVVGLPGDIVETHDGVLYVNYMPFDDIQTDDFGPVRVGPGELFVIGDNRGNSTDSRVLGCINQSQVLSVVIWHQ